ncbi:histidine phosphatase family protein [Marinovum sp. 2_MG-2023]|uniref:histidine phosphatase family protein n=1 Tax=Roseobacteraceae TaxID=2854170 RepID=UPI001FD025F3|nr:MULTISPECIES: histidine phosphatase family protein [Roseobacteraceae]MCJ7874181.1 histidine phosphatase family protein [Phaeobacter sp. J2-8]MDO6730213.1 histidine phosphatase family protein [Marinovum sp. 2_MG-2023]MDO6778951.1 histidine phosphatase family protein [Marinovum sp. 1_MG-2023]
MTHITLVRHGQANTHAKNATDYDRLSPLGAQQAEWLGHYLAQHDAHFDHVWAGDMARHRATALGMGHATPEIDARLNEFDYFSLARVAEADLDLPAPQSPEEFTRHIPQLMQYWRDDAIGDAPEMFGAFEERAKGAIDDILSGGGRALVVTSGGLIAMVLRHVLALDIPEMTRLMFQLRNSSVTEIEYLHGHMMLVGYNAIPHLAAPDRAHARTFI